MARLICIFIITFLMVFQTNAEPRGHWGHGGGDWHGGGGRHWGEGFGRPDAGTAFLGGIVGGLLGGLFAPEPPPPPVPEIVEGSPAWMAYCQNKYKSFNPETGTYTGYDGQQHPCQ